MLWVLPGTVSPLPENSDDAGPSSSMVTPRRKSRSPLCRLLPLNNRKNPEFLGPFEFTLLLFPLGEQFPEDEDPGMLPSEEVRWKARPPFCLERAGRLYPFSGVDAAASDTVWSQCTAARRPWDVGAENGTKFFRRDLLDLT